jgi:hypothetical protein
MDALRGRFMRLRAGTAYDALVEPTGISAATLKGFVHGRPVNERTILAIEAWCDRTDADLKAMEKERTHDAC